MRVSDLRPGIENDEVGACEALRSNPQDLNMGDEP